MNKTRPFYRHRTEPADMTLLTLKHYYYDMKVSVRNWVFPIEIDELPHTNGHDRRPVKRELDSQPKIIPEKVAA